MLFCVCGVLGPLAPVHRCARSVWCVGCAVSWATWLLFTGVLARFVVFRVRCPGPPGSCSPVCPLGVLFRVCGVLGLLAPVHRCAHSVCCFACGVSWASWLLFTGVPARCVVLAVRCPGPPGSCSPVCPLGALFCVCGVLGLLAPVLRCARSVCCVACAVSWAIWLLFTGVPARCVVSRARCPGPLGSCSPVCSLCVLCFGLRVVCCCAGRRCGALTRPSGRQLFVAGRGWVPSGRALAHPDGGCSVAGRGWIPPGRALVHPDGGWCACVCVCVCVLGRVGRAGLPGAFWCASPFPLAALSFCFAWPPPGWGCPPLSRCCCRSSLPWRCVLVVFLGLPLPGSPCARASFVSPAWPLAALWWLLPSPPPLLRLTVFVAPAWCLGVFFSFFFFFSSVRPRCFWLSLVSGPGCPRPRRCALFALLAFRFSAPRALVPLSCFPPGCWLLPDGCCPPPLPLPFVSPGFRRCRSVLCAVCCVVLCVPGCGAAPRCCALCRPVLCCRVLCCARLCRCLLRRALWRCPSPWGPVLCGVVFCGVPPRCVLCVFCRGAVVRAVVRRSVLCCVCPGLLCCAFPVLSALCGAVLRCAGALASCCSCGACYCWRLVLWCAAVCCAVSCGVPWCGAGSGGPWLSAGGVFRCRCPCLAAWSASLWLVWFAVMPCFPVSCSVVLCCRVVLCCCALLSCCGAVGACFALLWVVVLCCVVLLVGCAVFCPVVVSACCGALFLVLCVPCLLCSVRCGALLCWLWRLASLCRVLWRCAVAWCCAVVLCCRFAVLFVFALPSCGLSCGATVVCAVVGASCCGVSLCVVVSPWAFCGVVVLLWCVVVSCCAVRCPVVSGALCRVLRCRAALRCCAGWLCCAVVCTAGVCFSFCPLFLC